MSRIAPPKVAPITVNQVRFEQRLAYPGFLFSVSSRDGSLLWVQQVYPQKRIAEEEWDVQIVYLKSMRLLPDKESLELVDERNRKHRVSILEKERGSEWPVTLSLVRDEIKDGRREVLIELGIRNFGDRPLSLDPVSVCEGGLIENSLFEVTLDQKKIEYSGIMKKRTPPSRFVVLKPGAQYTVQIDIAKAYELPADVVGTLEMRMDTFNHFSPDEYQFKSNFLELTLTKAK